MVNPVVPPPPYESITGSSTPATSLSNDSAPPTFCDVVTETGSHVQYGINPAGESHPTVQTGDSQPHCQS